jgi:hypothetical protein
MKNQTNQLHQHDYAETHAKQAISRITKWFEEHYPQVSTSKKSSLITQCLIEVRRETLYRSSLN